MFSRYCFLVVFLVPYIVFSQNWTEDLKSARKSYKEKSFKEASNKYSKIEKKLPKSNDFRQEIAQNYYRSENYKIAEKKYQSSINSSKDYNEKASSFYNLGNTYIKQQKISEAIESYKQSLRLNPNDDDCRYNLAMALKKQQESNSSNQKQNSQNKNNKTEQKQQKENSNNKQEQQKTDRILDELRKKESEVKKKSSNKRQDNEHNSSDNNIKDW